MDRIHGLNYTMIDPIKIKKISALIEKVVFLSITTCLILLTISFVVSLFIPKTRKLILKELDYFYNPKGENRARISFTKKLNKFNLSKENLELKILIRKKNRTLILMSKDTIISSYPVGLGKSVMGMKLNGDDNKTPEGDYKICRKVKNAKYHLFLQINYPGSDDAKRGAVQQILLPSEEEKIEKAWINNKIPPANTAMGGPIGIHGFGAESNWTKGSIAMHQVHIEELFWNVATETPVYILQ